MLLRILRGKCAGIAIDRIPDHMFSPLWYFGLVGAVLRAFGFVSEPKTLRAQSRSVAPAGAAPLSAVNAHTSVSTRSGEYTPQTIALVFSNFMSAHGLNKLLYVTDVPACLLYPSGP